MSGNRVTVTVLFDRIPLVRRMAEEAAERARISRATSIADRASARSPVDTGTEAASWEVVPDRATHTAYVQSTDPKTKYQEFGTVHNPAQPALTPAMHEAEHGFPKQVEELIRDAIE